MSLSTPLSTVERVTPGAVHRALTSGKRDIAGMAFRVVLLLSLLLTILILGTLILEVVSEGRVVLAERFGSFMTSGLRSQPGEAGISQGLRGTFWIGIFTIAIAFPLGIATAVYLEEYAKDTRLTRFITINIRNLAGVPSIVYGILGFAILVKSLGGLTGGRSIIAAGITIAILVLPLVIITSSEALRAVPTGLREASYGVGATRWEVVRSTVMPYAAPGILTGTVLSLARALGEAAPLILVGAVTDRLGSNPGPFEIDTLRERFTAMPNVITTFAGRPQAGFPENTAAAIIVLLVIVLLFNAAAILFRNRFEKKRN